MALIGGLLGVAVGWGILRTNVKNLRDDATRIERDTRDTAIALNTKVEGIHKDLHAQDIMSASIYVHKDVFEIAVKDLKERLRRIEYKTDKYNGKSDAKLEDY
jgi:hypothetical protein